MTPQEGDDDQQGGGKLSPYSGDGEASDGQAK